MKRIIEKIRSYLGFAIIIGGVSIITFLSGCGGMPSVVGGLTLQTTKSAERVTTDLSEADDLNAHWERAGFEVWRNPPVSDSERTAIESACIDTVANRFGVFGAAKFFGYVKGQGTRLLVDCTYKGDVTREFGEAFCEFENKNLFEIDGTKVTCTTEKLRSFDDEPEQRTEPDGRPRA